MTLDTTASRVSYPGAGSTGPFAFPFKVFAYVDLLVTRRSSTGVETELTYVTDFSATGAGSASGTITLVNALEVGERLVIRRAPDLTQDTSVRNGGPYFGSVHEDEFDLLVMQIQSLQDQIDRSPKLLETYDPSTYDMTGLVPEPNKVLAFNSSGTGIEARTISEGSTALPGNGRTVGSLTDFLANNAVFNVQDFGPVGHGLSDEIALGAFQRAHDALPSTGGVLYVPSDDYLVDGSGATLAAPRILCSITKPNVRVTCAEGVKFSFEGWSKADSDANNDAGAGTNVFTGFLFNDGVVGGGVWGGYVEGDSDGTALTNLRSRAKFVAIDGADDVTVFGLRGKLIVGNLVNARGSGSGLSAAQRVIVSHCHGESCAESAFNYMGGVEDSVFSNNISRLNKYHGFESGAQRLSCTGNVLTDNVKDGITHVGRHGTFSGNVLRNNGIAGFNFQWSASPSSDGSYNTLIGNVITNNALVGVQCDGSTTHNAIKSNEVLDNGSGAGEGIKLAIGCSEYTIVGNTVGDTGVAKQATGIDVITGTSIFILGNRTYGHATQGLTVNTNSDNIRVIGNDFGDTVVIAASTTNKFVRNNRGYVTENKGTAIVPNGSTTVVVNHGLSVTPTAGDVSVTPTNSMGAAAKYFVGSYTATQFTITVNADPGATTASFAWSASVQ